jgi:hypothetical protein
MPTQEKRLGADTEHWMDASSDMMQAIFGSLIVLWAFDNFYIVASVCLFAGFLLFHSSSNSNGRSIYLQDNRDRAILPSDAYLKDNELKLTRSIRYGEFSFSLAFTLFIIGLAYTVYAMFAEVYVAGIIYLVVWWVAQTYSWGVYRSHIFKNAKNRKMLLLEIISLVILAIDYAGYITIP